LDARSGSTTQTFSLRAETRENGPKSVARMSSTSRFSHELRRTAKTPGNYTKRPEVKAPPARAAECRKRRSAAGTERTNGTPALQDGECWRSRATDGRARSRQADPRPNAGRRDEAGRSRVHPPTRSGRPHGRVRHSLLSVMRVGAPRPSRAPRTA
jgi:hypothetical protein